MMERKMIYKADPLIFERAKELRINMTHAEMIVLSCLRTNPGGFTFRRQHSIANYIVDFFCFKLTLVIDVDGGYHNDVNVKLTGKEREENMRAQGTDFLRFTNKEILYGLDNVIAALKSFVINKLIKNQKEGAPTHPLRGRGVSGL